MRTENDIPARVARGVALLDEKRSGWAERIDLETLDLASPCGCVLGQTWDEGPFDDDDPYFMQARELFGNFSRERDAGYGFNVYAGAADGCRAIDAEFDALTAEWRRVIEERRAGAR